MVIGGKGDSKLLPDGIPRRSNEAAGIVNIRRFARTARVVTGGQVVDT
jgi:hypothetical protein